MIGSTKKKGFTLIELMLVIAIVGILMVVVAGAFINNMGATERRAYAGAQKFTADNNIQPKRMTCAGDSGGDGYGTCTLSMQDGERIYLQCPTDYFSVNLWGAQSCKEVDMQLFQIKGR